MDCVSDVRIVVGHLNDDHNGGDEGFPKGLWYLNEVPISHGSCV
jgi:hypothetical protein